MSILPKLKMRVSGSMMLEAKRGRMRMAALRKVSHLGGRRAKRTRRSSVGN